MNAQIVQVANSAKNVSGSIFSVFGLYRWESFPFDVQTIINPCLDEKKKIREVRK